MSTHTKRWQEALAKREAEGLLRQRPLLQSPQGVDICLDGRQFLSFASNDYLGLANHPDLIAASKDALDRCGVGGGASHLVCGHHQEHEQLERELAEFTGREKALIFSSGYMANLAVISALASQKALVLEDKLNHASLIDGGLLSGARFQRYLHNDSESLATYFKRFSAKEHYDNKLVVTDGVFSMDGDVAPLDEMAKIAQANDAILVVDDAHGLGVLGEQGKGSLHLFKLSTDQVPVLIGTFGKAFGTSGAFVAGSGVLIDYLEQFARPYIYTTSMPPALAAATRTSLSLIKSGDELRAKLASNIRYFRSLAEARELELMDSDTAIQPILLKGSERTMTVSNKLKEHGFLVGAIRHPTVPNNSARLRIAISAAHTPQMIDSLFKALDSALSEPEK